MVVELDGCGADRRTGVVLEQHHPTWYGQAGWEKVAQPELLAARPGLSRVVGTALEIEPVDCHNAEESRLLVMQTRRVSGERTRLLAGWLGDQAPPTESHCHGLCGAPAAPFNSLEAS